MDDRILAVDIPSIMLQLLYLSQVACLQQAENLMLANGVSRIECNMHYFT